MTALRRGACPTLAAPMESGDGLLARLAPSEGLTPCQLARLARAAAQYGNGVMEITGRGSLQIRGLSPATAPDFAAEAEALGLAASGPPVLTGPLAGRDPEEIADPRPLAAALRAFDGPLLPKVSVVVDGGGQLSLDDLAADLRLRATPAGWLVSAGGDAATARPLGLFDATGAVTAGLALLLLLSGRMARARDLDLPVAAVSTPPSRPSALPLGRFALRQGIARAVILPFGHASAATLAALATAALTKIATGLTENGKSHENNNLTPLSRVITDPSEPAFPASSLGPSFAPDAASSLRPAFSRDPAASLGAGSSFDLTPSRRPTPSFGPAAFPGAAPTLRPAPGGALIALGLDPAADRRFTAAARRLGLILAPGDPRLDVVACPGAPACARGRLPTRAMAEAIAQARVAPGGLRLHLSGCEKRCAQPPGPAVTLLATPEGPVVTGEGVPVPHDLRAWLLARAEAAIHARP